MSMDMNPVPGLPLLSELFCNVTTVKKVVVPTCAFPDILLTKKSFYGGIPGIGLGFVEIVLIALFFLLRFKMKNDISKYFLTAVYLPLGLSSIFKLACGAYSFMLGAYGFFYMTFLMFFNVFYTTSILTVAIGSVFYLAANIIIYRKRQNFSNDQMWYTYVAILFLSILLSSSYTFIAQKWNQLPASGIFFAYILSTISIFILLLASLCAGLCCGKKATQEAAKVLIPQDLAVSSARTRLGYGCLFVLIFNIPHFFEIYVKITELFTPYLWTDDAEKTTFYSAQAIQLLTFDVVRIFFSLLLLISMFINASGRAAIMGWVHHSADKKKIFIATQKVPLLADTNDEKSKDPTAAPVTNGKKDKHAKASKSAPPVTPETSSTVTTSPPSTATTSATASPTPSQPVSPPPSNVVVPASNVKVDPNNVFVPSPPSLAQQNPMAPPAMNFPGMMHFPPNMQTTIVYTPTNFQNGGMYVEELK